jgi:LacI family transcriptional regulator
MPVTMRDVAQAAGVSVSTASRALSGRRPVSPEIERAVVEASRQLGYRANSVARSLRMGSTATVGMVVPVISNPYFPLLVEAVEGELSRTGRQLLLCDSRDDVALEGARVDALLDRRIDGLVFVACDSRASEPTLSRAAAQVPVVQMDRFVDGADVDFVGVDNEVGMAEVIAHLHARGCRSFALVSSRSTTSSARLRLRGYDEAVRPLDGASADRVLLGDYTVAWGREAVTRLLEAGPLPDAVVCGADLLALGALAALAEAGVHAPADVAVTGFDDIAFAELSSPPLTTVRQPADAIGAECARMLQERLTGGASSTQRRLLRPRLVIRATSPLGGPSEVSPRPG